MEQNLPARAPVLKVRFCQPALWAAWLPKVVLLAAMHAAAAVAQEAPAAEAPAVAGGGAYLNLFWLLFLALCLGAWFCLTAWVSNDAVGNGLKSRRWTAIMLGGGGLGAICALLVHPAFGFAILVCMALVLALYIRERNEVVPEQQQLFTRLSPAPRAGQEGAPAQARGEERLKVEIVNDAGSPLSEFVSGESKYHEAALVLGDMVGRASLTRASAARIEPGGEGYAVQFMLDDVPQQADVLAPEVGQATLALLARFAQISGKQAKDARQGRMTAALPGGEKVEMTVRGVKTPHGPAIVMDMPDWTAGLCEGGLSALGMHPAMIERLKGVLGKSATAVILSGPPRSGRSATFAAAVREIDIFRTDVITMSRRIEHPLDQVTQLELDLDSEQEFQQAMHRALREEPNVIAVDELTGAHLGMPLLEFAGQGGCLLATLQASSSGQAVQRLLLSVDAALVSRTLALVVNQRLMRKLCEACREPYEPGLELLSKLKVQPEQAGTWFKPVGCGRCMSVGYLGRTGLFELLIVNDALRQQIASCRVTPESAVKAAGKAGIRTLRQDGVLKVRKGITTLDEVRRVLE